VGDEERGHWIDGRRLPAGAHFQSREYAEYQDQRGYNAEHDPAASTQPWHGKEVSHWHGTRPQGGRLFTGSTSREWELYDATANKLLGSDCAEPRAD
jgi:hypothetical protein